tara:strand:- start:473 stop:940 length:468 start_codon:yes stop_codon:yes gene_type:complete
MPKITLYIRDDDTPIWERARSLAGSDTSLSVLVRDALREHLERRNRIQRDSSNSRKMSEHRLSIGGYVNGGVRRDVRLMGVKLAHAEAIKMTYVLFFTGQGRWVVHSDAGSNGARIDIFNNFQALAGHPDFSVVFRNELPNLAVVADEQLVIEID